MSLLWPFAFEISSVLPNGVCMPVVEILREQPQLEVQLLYSSMIQTS